MTRRKPVFEVDKQGLAKILARRGKELALLELWQNSADEEGVSEIEMSLAPDGNQSGRYELVVEDDAPEGFADLAHAYTLFAESKKKADPRQRGRFNLGEKLVIALCSWVQISTTKGLVEFTDEGRMEYDDAREHGSRFHAMLEMTEEEAQRAEDAIHSLIVPAGITTRFNGVKLPERAPLHEFEVSLRTEIADEEGYLRPTRRKTRVAVYEPRDGEVACLYEMGIPVVETGDTWHVDLGQKVPLTTDRDNVPPGYLRDVRAAVLNECAHLLTPDSAGAKWVDDALEDEAVEGEAVKAVVTERYGEKVVIEDRTDQEGTKIAVSKGYTVIPGGAFSKPAWKAVKQAEAARPAGQVTPSPNPNVGDEELKLMDPEHWPEGVKVVAEYAQMLADRLLGETIRVRVVSDIKWPFAATYGKGSPAPTLTLNYGRLGHKWFAAGRTEAVDALLLHELAHHRVADHLNEEFADEIGRLGAKLAQLALDDPSGLVAFEIERVGAVT